MIKTNLVEYLIYIPSIFLRSEVLSSILYLLYKNVHGDHLDTTRFYRPINPKNDLEPLSFV